MKNYLLVLALLLVVLSGSFSAAGESRYVTDELFIALREGKGNNQRVIKTLKSGVPLQVIADEGEYVLVRTDDGDEGYVPARYITAGPLKSQIIATLEKERDALRARLAVFDSRGVQQIQAPSGPEPGGVKDDQFRQSTEERESCLRSLEQAETALAELREKHDRFIAQAKDVAELAADRDRLQNERERVAGELQTMSEENTRLRRSAAIKWFLAGAAVLFLGWAIGKASRRRRTPW